MTHPSTRLAATSDLVGALEITADDGWGSAGSTVIVPARITNPGPELVQILLTVQGLSPSWCPPAQVLFLPAGDAADVFMHVHPAQGTPPGRYLWALTAQTAHHPMQAVTVELVVRAEPPPVPAARRPSRRRRRWFLAAGAVGLATLFAVTVPALYHFDPATPKTASRKSVSPERPTPSGKPTPVPVAVAGTILAGEVGRVRVTVVRFTLDDLSDQGRSRGTPVTAKVQVKGKHWTSTLPAGVYGMTFRQKGYEPASIVVDTATLGSATPPVVQLRPVSQEEGSGKQRTGQQDDGDD